MLPMTQPWRDCTETHVLNAPWKLGLWHRRTPRPHIRLFWTKGHLTHQKNFSVWRGLSDWVGNHWRQGVCPPFHSMRKNGLADCKSHYSLCHKLLRTIITTVTVYGNMKTCIVKRCIHRKLIHHPKTHRTIPGFFAGSPVTWLITNSRRSPGPD